MNNKEYWLVTILGLLAITFGVVWLMRVPGEKAEPEYLQIDDKRDEIKITEIVPLEGLIAGGEQILIKGENFPEGSEVLFGEILSPLVERKEEGNELVAQAPEATQAGGVKIRVLTPQGQFIESERFYFYLNK